MIQQFIDQQHHQIFIQKQSRALQPLYIHIVQYTETQFNKNYIASHDKFTVNKCFLYTHFIIIIAAKQNVI